MPDSDRPACFPRAAQSGVFRCRGIKAHAELPQFVAAKDVNLERCSGLVAHELLLQTGRGDAQAIDGQQPVTRRQPGGLRSTAIVHRGQADFIAMIFSLDAERWGRAAFPAEFNSEVCQEFLQGQFVRAVNKIGKETAEILPGKGLRQRLDGVLADAGAALAVALPEGVHQGVERDPVGCLPT